MPPPASATSDTVNLQDVSSSEALRVLDTLVEIGQISEQAAADAKARVSELYNALVSAATEERELAVQAAQLAKDRDASQAAAAAAQRKAAEFEGVSIEILREDVETALAESTLAQERAALMALEQQELQRQRDQLAEHLDGVAVQHAAALAPVISSLQEEITGLKRELDQQRLQAAVTQQELEGMTSRLGEVELLATNLHKEHKQEAGRLASVSAAPEKARRQADLAVADLAAAHQLLAAAETKRMEVESAVRGVNDQLRQRQMDYASAMSALERARIMLDAKDRHSDDVSRDLELAGLEKEQILGDQAGVAMATQALCREVRMQQEQLARAKHDKLLALRAYKAAEDALREAQEELPPLKIARELTTKDKVKAQAELAATIAEKEDLKKQVDVRIAQVLKEEAFAKDKVALFNITQQEVALLEQESAALKDEDRQLTRLLADMAAQRDRVARQVAVQHNKHLAASAAAKLRTRQEEELRAMVAEQERKAKEFERLFDLIRNQRNRFVALIATARQAATEMTDRLRLLSSEQEILTAEVATKAQLLDKAHSARTVSVKERDALMNELHSLAGSFRSKHDKLHEQIEAIKNVNGLIKKTQGVMASTKKSYEAAVQARNATGVMLIDRNDELAALHEKAHTQEALIAAGTMELSIREDELRVLTLQISELERSIHTSKVSMPDLPGIDRDIASLKADLLRAKQRSSALGEQVVDPSNTSRIRLLGGRIPEKEELVAKLQSLEERLGMQQDSLMEKGVVLEEVDALTSHLREEAAAARPVGASLAAAANAYQERLRKVTRGMMATISELSLYQATALKLHATKVELEQVVQQARARLEAGLPPTDDAEMEWCALLRQQQTLEDLKAQREEVAAILDAKGHVLVSSAEPRPNAYIPEDLGIPKPYRGFSPFKPSAPGSTMRHIRKPVPQDVVL